MYQALLVEDEEAVREAIARKIDWKAHGFTLAGTCENGKQALDVMEKYPADLIVTDINMPVMDGLELARQVSERWPDTAIVLLTGFDEFKYAQTAIRYKVQEYVLKPVTPRQLRELLDKLRLGLDARASGAARTRADAKDRLLWRLLSEEISAGEIEYSIQDLSLSLTPGPCRCVLAGISGEAFDENSVLKIKSAFEGKAELLPDGSGRLALFCHGPHPGSWAVGAIREASGSYASRVCAVIGSEVGHAGLLCRSFAQARQAWDHLYRMAPGQTLEADEILSKPPSEPFLEELREAVLRRVRLLDRDGAGKALDAFTAALRSSTWTRDVILGHIQSLALSLMEYAKLHELGADEGISERLAVQPDLDSAHGLLLSYVDGLVDAGSLFSDSANRHGLIAVEYIKEHYMDPSLSLNRMTELLSVSTSYFSSMFKSHTGVTFIEYLTRLRVSRAEELILTTDKRNYEIASEVGYDDPGYFRSIFKKYTKLSPSEYRKRHNP